MIDQNKLQRLAREYLTEWDAQYAGPLRSYWGERAVLQLQYAARLSAGDQDAGTELVGQAVEAAGLILRLKAHEADLPASGRPAAGQCLAKQYTLLCIGHAHIDMNWMWSYDETVSITLDTFRTMLDLMCEYPEFTYAQSQAAVYEIVARHDPAMLAEIRGRVQEGRWEVTAATWVEADRNLPNGESMVRQLLYTRQYLSELLGIPPEKLDLDYEPDTFGHHRDVPEILQAAGIRYYYHCRGSEGPLLYHWQAPSGRSVLAFREPLWYNWTIDGRCALAVPEFCRTNGLQTMLRVYGVGDHGGGPTRRDIERIRDMNTWPVFPNYQFGTYREFYRAAEAVSDRLPVVRGELNFIFDGCYTTQTRIKRGNRRSEAILYEAETIGSLTHMALLRPYAADACRAAWKNVLFNQFHDILPGSGTVDTREYALGLYQQTYALGNTQRADALRFLASQVDTAALAVPEDIRLSRSEGAGVGFPTGSGNLAQVGRHAGLRRIFLVWNSLPFDREETCTITLWDWPGDSARMHFTDGQSRNLEHQVLKSGINNYWGHLYQTVLVRLPVPAMGYATLVLDENPQQKMDITFNSPRVIRQPDNILENEYLRVQISEENGSILSLIDKATGQELARPDLPLLVFRLIEEDTDRGMTAWVVGRYRKITELAEGARITGRQIGLLRSGLTWQLEFGRQSSLEVTLALESGERQLRCDVKVRWQEIGTAAAGIPQLNLQLRPAYPCNSFRYDVPLGPIDRPAIGHDVPALSYGLACNPAGSSLLLVSDSKYGFRGTEDGLALTLIRSSFDPDPWPEIGEHVIRVAIALAGDSNLADSRNAQAFNHPLHGLASRAQAGKLPLSASLARIKAGQVRLEAVKISEDGQAMIVRLCSLNTAPETACLEFFRAPRHACLADIHEQPVPESAPGGGLRQPVISGQLLSVALIPGELATLRINF